MYVLSVTGLWILGLFSQSGDGQLLGAISSEIEKMATSKSLFATAKSALHFCGYVKSCSIKDVTGGNYALSKALHLQPWNMHFHWSFLKNSLPGGGREFLAQFDEPTTDVNAVHGVPGVSTLSGPLEDVGMEWVSTLSLIRNAEMLDQLEGEISDKITRVKRHLRLHPQSFIGWFLFSLLSSKSSTPDSRSLKTGIAAYKLLRDSIQAQFLIPVAIP